MNKRTWAEVDLDAIAHNMREIRRITDPKAQIMADLPWQFRRRENNSEKEE